MLSKEKQMELLEAFDLTKSYRAAAQLCGVDHHTVKRVVVARATGYAPDDTVRTKVARPFTDKIEELVDRSSGKIRADVVHERLVAMGYSGSERTTRRVVATIKTELRHQTHRIYRPWIPEPGLWLQYDFGTGPTIDGSKTILFCAWAAWSRFRVILPLADRTMPSVIAALDRTFRLLGGTPTYVLTDNEKTVTDGFVCGMAIRNTMALSVAAYYGTALHTCVPYDPESKGGVESTVKLAKADLVPTTANLLPAYSSFAELATACAAQMDKLNTRVHTVTRRVPTEMLEIEREHLHAIPDAPYVAAFGVTRSVGWSSTISFDGARYSVPHVHAGTRVWVRRAADEVVIVTGSGLGATEIARHRAVRPGHASITDGHYPSRPVSPGARRPRATSDVEARFLSLGEGAVRYVIEAASSGARRITARMQEALVLSSLHGKEALDEALGLAAFAGRFLEGDLESILVHASTTPPVSVPPAAHSLARGTGAWSGFTSTSGDEVTE
ncbi:MAG TPA: IS21 family transposase [Acidimicrobiales bacterium]|jgi:hypothetical protein|nr:IS21 family transposase [Acidimicrobiales bacterium]